MSPISAISEKTKESGDERAWDTSPGFWRPLTPTAFDYTAFRAGYRYFEPVANLKADFSKTPLTPPFDASKDKIKKQRAVIAGDENQFRKIAPSLYVAFDTVVVEEDVARQVEAEQTEIRKLKQQMESLRENGQAWQGKDKSLKDLMAAYGVAVFLDVNEEPEYIHCYERTQELTREISKKTSTTAQKRTIKVFRLLSVPPGTSSRGMKVKIGDHTADKPREKVITTSDQAVTAKMAPVPRP